ncbi:hypothetical protein F511_22996 [Dorcoceras hygrometricum]|uniref:Dystroglycan-like n=1 Tax=Dorcoceras hygrometricum TaxID=472368 RepID=A0A2Z7BPK2_9LAMI|nr:hypothetical protein F511_22996 [Dorcoceras hygrometricum]
MAALTTRNQQLSRSSPRSFCSFKWVAIEREVHKEPSAIENTQIFDGERRKSREENLGILRLALMLPTTNQTQQSSRNYPVASYPVATIQSQAIQSQAKPKAGRFLTTGTRRNPRNAVFQLNQTTSRCSLDWFLNSTAGHPVATQFPPVTGSSIHRLVMLSRAQRLPDATPAQRLIFPHYHQLQATVTISIPQLVTQLQHNFLSHSLHSKSTTMASIFSFNSYQINFESVLMIPDHDGMLNMFKALEANGLRGFLGCESVLYEKELEQFFETALVHGEDITGAVSGKFFSISQAQFAHVFELPTKGLVNFSEVPKDRVYDARSIFSKKGVQVEIHGKKKHMKYEFRLLNDILEKAVTVKAGSFDAVTTERFQMMTVIHFGLKVNWSKVLFNVVKDMVDKSQRKAKGFDAQIGALLKGIPAIALGEGVPFPLAKNLSMKTLNTYIATNTTIDAREEQGMVSEAIVKRKSKSTKKSSSTDDTPAKVISEISASKKRVATEDNAPAIPKKRRTVKTKPSPSQASLDIVNVAQDVVPIQELVKDTDEAAVKPTDEVDIIIEQVLEETLRFGVSEEEYGGQGIDEAAFSDDFAQWLDDFVARNSEPESVGTRTITEAAGSNSPVVVKDMNRTVSSIFTNEEHMSIDDLLLQISDDMLLPSITATEITKIRLGESISITEVRERNVYLASLPRISIHDKGKAILEEDETIRGNPAREMVELICGDIEFLVRLRDQVMIDVVEFFHSFSLNKLSNFDALLALKEKQKLMLEWVETDSLAMALKRKEYVLAKYRELLLRKFLDSHRRYFAPGQPWTATASQIIDLLSDAHSISLEDLLAQQHEHGLPMEQPCASTVFDSSVDSCAVLARFYSAEKSTCWVRPMILINGVWTPLQGPDFWKSSCRLSLFLNQKKMPEPVIDNIFVPHVLFIEPIQYWEAAPCLIRTWKWTKVCTEIIQFSMFGCLRPVREDVFQEIVVYNLGVERLPADFLKSFTEEADLFNHLLQIKFEIVDMLQIWKSWKRLRKEFVRQIDGKEKEIDREEKGGLAEVERLKEEEDIS